MPPELFNSDFLSAVQELVSRHHSIYPRLPPQGVFFEALVEQAFLKSGWETVEVIPTTPNSPWHDLLVGGVRLSIKSETGKGTRKDRISITKLCTTETGEWNAAALVGHALDHIAGYDRMLMIRAVSLENAIEYALIEIPLQLLRMMANAEFRAVGKRPGRRSIAAHVMDGEERVFRVHFDGADGKCQVQDLLVERCLLLRRWQQPF